MIKSTLVVVLTTVLMTSSTFGQISLNKKAVYKKCYTVEAMDEARKKNPGIETDAQFELWLSQKIQSRAAFRTNTAYNLPVVFHVVHNSETEGTGLNLTQALIKSQLNQLNKDFANRSNSPYGVAASTDIQFSLAQKDPANATLAQPGIDRIDRNTKGWTAPGTSGWSTSYITSTIKPGSIWDPTKYINIWILPMSGGILGYATFPGSSTLNGLNNSETSTTAGVVIETNTLGSVVNPGSTNCSSNPYNMGRTMTHELGHYFGLRHIWGDSNCGDDYVGDTPVHADQNGGSPTHPKPNSCGTADEMFENYMDYSDDVVLNTFTAGQVARMQTVMMNSPRRVELATSTVGLVAAPSNKIAFIQCGNALTVSEKSVNATLPLFKDIPVLLNVEDKATGNATITITTGGTAVAGTDYQVLNPTINFVAGDGLKVINIRILDNAVPEPTKTIVIGYNISGSGVTASALNQSFVITLTDDDNIRPGENPLTILSEAFETAGGALPTGWDSYIEPNSPNYFVVSANGNAGGSGQAAHITNNTTTKPNAYTKTAKGRAILRTPLIDASNVSNVRLQYKYRIIGESYGAGEHYDFGFAVAAPQASGTDFSPISTDTLAATIVSAQAPPAIQGTTLNSLNASFNDQKFYLGFWWENDDADGFDPGFNVDDVVVTADGTRIETAVNATNAYAITASTINNFKSKANNKLIAVVSAANANIAQLTATILEAGNDKPALATQSGTYGRSRKVFQLNPSVTDNTTSYTATFYFTQAEVASWGAGISTARIMKLNNSANLAGTLSSADGVIATPTVDNKLSTDGYIAFTATFTGFSKFILVDANTVLPVRLLDFTGTLSGSKVKLNWKTTSEINNKGFEVERSLDANRFEKIGWVTGNNFAGTNTYMLDDIDISKGNRYYYRLKQIDKDENFSYSPVVSIAYLGGQLINWYPNPVKEKLIIQNSGPAKGSLILVTDITGKVMYKSQSLLSGKLEINTAAWAAGMYSIQVTVDGEPITFTVVKQ